MDFYILSNLEKHCFGASVKNKTELSLVGAKGEKVAFQAILPKPIKNVNFYTNGGLKTEIFLEKYLDITAPSSGYLKAGKYPDIMLDLDRAIRFGENNSETGELLVWCFAEIPPLTDKSEYSITLTAITESEKAFVTAKISVLDFCLPSENHSVTSFPIRDDMIRETDLDKKEEKYLELLNLQLDYRLSPTRIFTPNVTSVEKNIEKMKTLTKDSRCSAYAIPYEEIKADTIYEKNQPSLDIVKLKELMLAMAKNSSNEENLFKKGYFYIGFIDEPTPEIYHRVREVYQQIHNIKREVAKEYNFSEKREVELSLLTLDNIVTVFNKEPIYGEVDTYCPTFWGYSKPEYIYEEQKLRGLGKKNWWYGCVAPLTPFPNLHTDSPMADSRYESWLRYKYDITGNLYWATNLTKKFADNQYVDCDVLLSPTLYPGANGDGLLFYTETKYGKPLPSNRVFSMFLGLQEYEYFWLFDNYAEQATSFFARKMDTRLMLKTLFDRIAKGTMLVYDFDAEALRLELGSRVVFAKNNIFALSEYTYDGYIIKVFSPNNFSITCNGEKFSETACGKGKLTSFKIVTFEKFYANITAVSENAEKYSMSILLGEKRVNLPLEKAKSQSDKLKCEIINNELYVETKPFVNSEEVSLIIPISEDLSHLKSVELKVESLSNDAFITEAILIDKNDNKWQAGYEIVKENTTSDLSILVTTLTQNRLNNVDDAAPSLFIERNLLAANNFDFKNVTGLELKISNNIKLLDENHERKVLSYMFLIKDIFTTSKSDN